MTLRVPTPAIQGPQQLGVIQAQASDTPFQDLRLPDTAFNSRLLEQIGGDAVRLGEYLQEQEDERLLLEFQAGLGDWERQTLYGEMPDGTGAPEGGILSLEGQAAFGLTERLQQDFDTVLSEFNGPLSGLSANGRLAAQQYAQSRREALLDRATRIESEQREAYNRQLRAQSLAAAQGAAGFVWGSPEELAAAEARIRSAAEVYYSSEAATETAALSAVTSGAVGDARDRAAAETSMADIASRVEEDVATEVDAFYRQTIRTALLEGSSASVARARQIFDEGTERGVIRLSGPDDLLLRDVRFGQERDVVMSIATETFAQFPNDLGGAIEAVRALRVPGDQEQDIVQELQQRYEQAEAVARQREEQIYDDLMAEASEGRMSRTDPRLAGLSEEQIDALDRENRGLSRLSDPATSDLLQMMSPRQLAEINLNSYRARLSADEFDALRDRQRQGLAALQGDQAALLAEADTVQRQSLLNQTFAAYRLSGDNNAAFRSNITRAFEAWELDYRQREGQAPTNERRRQFLDDLLIETRRGTFGGRGDTLAEEILGEEAALLYPDIPFLQLIDIGQQLLDADVERNEATIRAAADGVPASEIAEIIAVIEDTRGLDVTRENIVEIYRRARGG